MGVSEGPSAPLHPLSGWSSISPLVISFRSAAAEISASEISAAVRRWTISHTIHLKSLTVRPASSGCGCLAGSIAPHAFGRRHWSIAKAWASTSGFRNGLFRRRLPFARRYAGL
jgi:hypothetical protein